MLRAEAFFDEFRRVSEAIRGCNFKAVTPQKGNF